MASIFVPFDTRVAHFENGHFRPSGKIIQVGDYWPNPVTDRKDTRDRPLWGARLIVGLNVGKKPTWTIKDVIRVVKEIRLAQAGDAGSSLLLQHGMYSWVDKKGKLQTTQEKSVQVIVINFAELQTPQKKFEKQMVYLGEELARRFKQQVVPIEVQKNGIVQWNAMIVP